MQQERSFLRRVCVLKPFINENCPSSRRAYFSIRLAVKTSRPLFILDFRFQTSDFRLQTSDFRLQTSNFKLQTSNFKLQTSNFKLQTSNFKLQTEPTKIHFIQEII